MVEACAHHNDILLDGIGTRQDRAEIVQIARVAHGYEDVPGTHAHGATTQFLIAVDAELVELLRLTMALAGDVPLRQRENHEKHGAENDAGDGGFVLGEKIYDGGDEQHGRDYDETKRDLRLADMEVTGNAPFAVAGFGEAQDQDGQRLHGKAPDHTEGVQRGKGIDVAAAEDDGRQLKSNH